MLKRKTGYDYADPKDKPLFLHFILNRKEYSNSSYEKEVDRELMKEKDMIPIISVLKTGKITCYHVTDVENLSSIEGKGLIIDLTETFIPDLGVGIYAVEKDNFEAHENLIEHLSDCAEMGYSSDEQVLIKFEYNGVYLECMSDDHNGYILIMTNIPPEQIIDTEIISIEDCINEGFPSL